MADKFDFIRQDVDNLKEAGLFINLRVMGSPADAWMIVEGYGKVLSRPQLDLRRRELCIVAACAAAGSSSSAA